MKSMTRVLAVGSLSLALSMVAEAGNRREEPLRSSKAGSVSLVCEVAQPATAKLEIHEFGIDPAPTAADPDVQMDVRYAAGAREILAKEGRGQARKDVA